MSDIHNNKVISSGAISFGTRNGVDTSFGDSSKTGNNEVISGKADISFGASSKTGINSVAKQLRYEADINFVTFCTPEYESNVLRLRDSIFSHCSLENTKLWVYTPKDLLKIFEYMPKEYTKNAKYLISSCKRGYGNMFWKPLVILNCVNKVKNGEVVIWLDADMTVEKPLTEILKVFEKKRMLFFYVGGFFLNNYKEKYWTKRKTFEIMGCEFNSVKFSDSWQVMSGIQFYTAGSESKNFLTQLVNYSCDNNKVITPEEDSNGVDTSFTASSKGGNSFGTKLPSSETGTNYAITDTKKTQHSEIVGFKNHRHDQSILSLLVKKKEYSIFRDPTQFGNYDLVEGSEYSQIFFNHNDMIKFTEPRIAIITPSIGHSSLARAMKSVQNQTYKNLEHVIVDDLVDWTPFESSSGTGVKTIVDAFSKKRRTVYYSKMPYNTGENLWNGHRVYAAFPHLLHHADFIAFLDEDNFYDPDHFESLIKEIIKKNSDWGFSLRRIVDKEGNYICDDNCESLGPEQNTVINKNDFLIDTSCYLLKRIIAIQTSFIWNRPTGTGGAEPDRDLCTTLYKKFPNYAYSNKHTLNYTVENRKNSVSKEFFIEGNKKVIPLLGPEALLLPVSLLAPKEVPPMELAAKPIPTEHTHVVSDTSSGASSETGISFGTKLPSNGVDTSSTASPSGGNRYVPYLPSNKVISGKADSKKTWEVIPSFLDGTDLVNKKTIYIFHFNEKATLRYFENENYNHSLAYEEWQMTLLNSVKEKYNIVNGYRNHIPSGSTVLVNICLPQDLPIKILLRSDIVKIGYTAEGPNIRHQHQWRIKTLESLFTFILTYWYPLISTELLGRHDTCSISDTARICQAAELIPPSESPKFIWCPFIHRLDLDNQLDRSFLQYNGNYDRSIIMILEYRENLRGKYKIDNTELFCLDPLRKVYTIALQKFLTVYGKGWKELKEREGDLLKDLKIGGGFSKFEDPKPNIEYIKNFTFNLIIENCDADDYVSEKFYDSLVSGAIPIYYGNIGKMMKKIIPDNVYIDAKKFTDPKSLEIFITRIGVKEILMYKKNVMQLREKIIKNVSPETYCRQLSTIFNK